MPEAVANDEIPKKQTKTSSVLLKAIKRAKERDAVEKNVHVPLEKETTVVKTNAAPVEQNGVPAVDKNVPQTSAGETNCSSNTVERNVISDTSDSASPSLTLPFNGKIELDIHEILDLLKPPETRKTTPHLALGERIVYVSRILRYVIDRDSVLFAEIRDDMNDSLRHVWQHLVANVNSDNTSATQNLRDRIYLKLKTALTKTSLMKGKKVEVDIKDMLFKRTIADYIPNPTTITEDYILLPRTNSKMPSTGLGLWKVSDGKTEKEVKELIRFAIECGCRRFDTAPTYDETERILGEVIRESSIPREEFFISTKLPDDSWHKPNDAIEKSAKHVVGYIDLYLIHHPVQHKYKEKSSVAGVTLEKVWKQITENKRVRHYGVCNFNITDIEEMIDGENTNGIEALPSPDVFQAKFSLFHRYAYADIDGKYRKVIEKYCNLQKTSVFDCVSMIQEVGGVCSGACSASKNVVDSAIGFSAFNCGGLVEGLLRQTTIGKSDNTLSENEILNSLLQWRQAYGYTGLVRCRSKEHIENVFGKARHSNPDHTQTSPQLHPARLHRTLLPYLDALDSLIYLPTVNSNQNYWADHDAIMVSTPPHRCNVSYYTQRFLIEQIHYSSEFVSGIEKDSALEFFLNDVQNPSRGYPEFCNRLDNLLKSNTIRTSTLIAVLEQLHSECKERGFVGKVQLYERVLKLLKSYMDNEIIKAKEILKDNERSRIMKELEIRREKDRRKAEKQIKIYDILDLANTVGFDKIGYIYLESKSELDSESDSSTRDLTFLTTTFINTVNPSLEKQNFSIIDGFLTAEKAANLRYEIFENENNTSLYTWEPGEVWVGKDKGGVGAHVHKPEMRDDLTVWVCGRHQTPISEKYFDSAGNQPENIQEEIDLCTLPKGVKRIGRTQKHSSKAFPLLNETLRTLDDLIYNCVTCKGELIERSDCLIAKYSGARQARFVKHVDNTQKDGRKLAVVLYLNEDGWEVERDGGDLRLHPNSNTTLSISPIAGRLAIFSADTMPHEVCPVINKDKDRYSILVWYFQRAERKEHIVRSGGSYSGDVTQSILGNNGFGGGSKSISGNTVLNTEQLTQELVKKIVSKDLSFSSKKEVEKYSDQVIKLAGKIIGADGLTKDDLWDMYGE